MEKKKEQKTVKQKEQDDFLEWILAIDLEKCVIR